MIGSGVRGSWRGCGGRARGCAGARRAAGYAVVRGWPSGGLSLVRAAAVGAPVRGFGGQVRSSGRLREFVGSGGGCSGQGEEDLVEAGQAQRQLEDPDAAFAQPGGDLEEVLSLSTGTMSTPGWSVRGRGR